MNRSAHANDNSPTTARRVPLPTRSRWSPPSTQRIPYIPARTKLRRMMVGQGIRLPVQLLEAPRLPAASLCPKTSYRWDRYLSD
jgi:hypothetical protein